MKRWMSEGQERVIVAYGGVLKGRELAVTSIKQAQEVLVLTLMSMMISLADPQHYRRSGGLCGLATPRKLARVVTRASAFHFVRP
jgi:hypothetical protein